MIVSRQKMSWSSILIIIGKTSRLRLVIRFSPSREKGVYNQSIIQRIYLKTIRRG